MTRVAVERLYAAFARLDGAAMQACYAPDATFGGNSLITTHRDRFNFWTWSRQALGAPGLLLGWSPYLRNKVRAQAASNLQRFLVKG